MCVGGYYRPHPPSVQIWYSDDPLCQPPPDTHKHREFGESSEGTHCDDTHADESCRTCSFVISPTCPCHPVYFRFSGVITISTSFMIRWVGHVEPLFVTAVSSRACVGLRRREYVPHSSRRFSRSSRNASSLHTPNTEISSPPKNIRSGHVSREMRRLGCPSLHRPRRDCPRLYWGCNKHGARIATLGGNEGCSVSELRNSACNDESLGFRRRGWRGRIGERSAPRSAPRPRSGHVLFGTITLEYRGRMANGAGIE